MAVKFKEKVKPVAKAAAVSTLTVEESEAVDRLLIVDKLLDVARPLIKEEGDLRKYLAAVASDTSRFPKAEVAKLESESGVVEFSPQGESREIVDIEGLLKVLRKKLGAEGALALIKINLSDVDKYLSTEESAPFLGKKPGSRKFLSVHSK